MEKQIYRALIVDDEPLIREATARAMGAHSFWCETADDGKQAIQKYQDTKYDLVVTDLRMPVKHGHALAVELLEQSEPPRVVVFTGLADSKLVKDLITRGVEDVIHKPVDFGVFATKMQSIFERNSWRESVCGEGPSKNHGPQYQQVVEIEKSLELLSLCIPESVQDVLNVDEDLLTEPPAAVNNYMRRQLESLAVGQNQRKEQRMAMLVTVVAAPVDRNFKPSGEPFKVAARDFSESGICLLHSRAVSSEYLALRWRSMISPKCYIRIVMQVKRCKPVGPFYEVAGQFVMHD